MSKAELKKIVDFLQKYEVGWENQMPHDALHIVIFRLGLNNKTPKTIHQIAEVLRLTPWEVRQLETKTIKRLNQIKFKEINLSKIGRFSMYFLPKFLPYMQSLAILAEQAIEQGLSIEVAGQLPIEELRLSTIAYNALRRNGIYTAEDVLSRRLLWLKNLGRKSFDEIQDTITQHFGVKLLDS